MPRARRSESKENSPKEKCIKLPYLLPRQHRPNSRIHPQTILLFQIWPEQRNRTLQIKMKREKKTIGEVPFVGVTQFSSSRFSQIFLDSVHPFFCPAFLRFYQIIVSWRSNLLCWKTQSRRKNLFDIFLITFDHNPPTRIGQFEAIFRSRLWVSQRNLGITVKQDNFFDLPWKYIIYNVCYITLHYITYTNYMVIFYRRAIDKLWARAFHWHFQYT